jgi:hypothetical protein
MSAEYFEGMKKRFNSAYAKGLETARKAYGSSAEGATVTMKVEFDAAMALVRDTTAETDWVRGVLAEHGYSGPLTEAACPLREMLNRASTTQPGPPERFCQYTIYWGGVCRQTFDLKTVQEWLTEAAAGEDAFTFTPEWFHFRAIWGAACDTLREGGSLSEVGRHALKLGTAAGLKIDL